MRARSILAVLLLGFALACGGGSGSGGSTPTGNLTLRFGSDSFPGFAQAWVSVEKVEASTNGSTWMALGNVQASYDLMTLQNGHSAVMLSNIAVPPATYTQFRITWATSNYAHPTTDPAAWVLPTGASIGQSMSMPVTTVIPGPVTVNSSASTTAQIMLFGQQPVQFRVGGALPYTFQATGQAYDLSKMASITGKLTDDTNKPVVKPIVGAEVYAETMDGFGTATIQRRAFTDGTGTYLLECLPPSSSTPYYVVAQPGGASSSLSYAALASPPLSTTAGVPTTANLVFSNPQNPGSLTLTITPASLSTEDTWGELRQSLVTGTPSVPQVFIVRSQTVATGLTQDQVGFMGLAPGYYSVVAQRSTAGGSPVPKPGSQMLVNPNAPTQAFISY